MNLRKISINVLFSFSGFVFGQQAMDNSQSIKSNFSTESIRIYQTNSQNKLDEFYDYLTMYSTERNSELKKQIRKNILSLAESDMRILDFTLSNPNEIEVEKFLTKIENQSYQFKIKSKEKPSGIGSNSWKNPYTLTLTQNGKSIDFEVNQIIIFEPREKQFGSKTKKVWEVKLGDILK